MTKDDVLANLQEYVEAALTLCALVALAAGVLVGRVLSK